MSRDYVPPQALDAETSLLGCLLLDADVWDDVDNVVVPSDFYGPAQEKLFRVILDMRMGGLPIDKVTVCEELRARGELERIGGPQYLSHLLEEIPTVASAKYYAELIREKSTLRSLISFGRKVQEVGFNGEGDVEGALATVERDLRAIIDRGQTRINLDRKQQVQGLLDAVAAAGERTDWLTCPWPTLDRMIGGFDEGELVVWIAAPKVGKSGVVLTLSDHVARQHGPTVLFALEMNAQATLRRHMAQLSGVSARKQRYGKLSGPEWEAYSEAVPRAGEIPLHIFGRALASIPNMRRALREVQRQEGSVKSIVVDHVGFLSNESGKRNESTHEKMDKVYRLLLDLAEEFRAPVHAVQHTNRAAYGSQQMTLASIRDGGNAEGHAHVIIGIHRPYPFGDAAAIAPGSDEARLPPDEQKKIGEFQILASRDGEAGIIPMRYTGHRNLWEEDVSRIRH